MILWGKKWTCPQNLQHVQCLLHTGLVWIFLVYQSFVLLAFHYVYRYVVIFKFAYLFLPIVFLFNFQSTMGLLDSAKSVAELANARDYCGCAVHRCFWGFYYIKNNASFRCFNKIERRFHCGRSRCGLAAEWGNSTHFRAHFKGSFVPINTVSTNTDPFSKHTVSTWTRTMRRDTSCSHTG